MTFDALDLDRAGVLFDDIFANGQAESRAHPFGSFFILFGREERVEYFLPGVRRAAR